MLTHNYKNKRGYTLIETMIAISIFLVIVTIGMGALLNASSLYNKAKDMRSIMDSLSFTMDDLSRNLRTGYDYYCIPPGSGPVFPDTAGLSGTSCAGIEFEPSGGGNPWAYEIATNDYIHYFIQKSIYSNGGGWVWTQMTPIEVSMTSTVNPFTIIGAEPPPGNNNQQPFVGINLSGIITYETIITPFSLQTSISQREINI